MQASDKLKGNPKEVQVDPGRCDAHYNNTINFHPRADKYETGRVCTKLESENVIWRGGCFVENAIPKDKIIGFTFPSFLELKKTLQ